MSNKNNEILFSVTVEDLQNEAVGRIGRKLTDKEVYSAQKGIESGLSFNIDTVIETAINEAIEDSKTEQNE